MMSEDAKAILLLCGHLGGESGVTPLSQREYTQVVRWLVSKALRPADLLVPEQVPPVAREAGIDEQRLATLLKRGVKLGFAVEQWNQSGIWVICRSDPEYPARYKTHLKEKAPPKMQDWVKALVAEGVLEEQVERKVKKVAVRKPEEELRLR